MSKKATAKLEFSSKAYSMKYLMENPPTNTKGLKLVWQAAVTTYFLSKGINVDDKKNYNRAVEGISFSELTKTFQKLAGVKSAPAKKSKKVS